MQTLADLWRKWFPPLDKLDRIYEALGYSGEPGPTAKKLGLDWTQEDAYYWNLRFARCEHGLWHKTEHRDNCACELFF